MKVIPNPILIQQHNHHHLQQQQQKQQQLAYLPINLKGCGIETNGSFESGCNIEWRLLYSTLPCFSISTTYTDISYQKMTNFKDDRI